MSLLLLPAPLLLDVTLAKESEVRDKRSSSSRDRDEALLLLTIQECRSSERKSVGT